MSDKLPILTNEQSNNLQGTLYGLQSSSHQNLHQYEELMQGSVPCPSCHGSGRIPKELESQLVAIIPMSDKRLKPRRTCLWVALAVLLSLLVSGLILFFFVPRTIELSTSTHIVYPVYALLEESRDLVNFMAVVNVTNDNYFPIRIINSSITVLSDMWESSQVVGDSFMASSIDVPMVATRAATINTTLNIQKAKFADLYGICSLLTWAYMRFQFTVTVSYLSHTEQSTYDTRVKLCCGSGANATYCGKSPLDLGEEL